MNLYELLPLLFSLLALFGVFLWLRASKKNYEYERLALRQKIDELSSQNEKLKENELKFLEEKMKLISGCEVLEARFEEKSLAYEQSLKSHLEEKEKLKLEYEQNLQNLEKKFDENLKNQSQNLLNQNKLMLNDDVKKLLEEIFIPVKKSVKEYSEKLSQNEISLKTNIENMFKFSQNIGQNADKLAKILKGDKKIRGNFAELQLKNVLESSGLVENEQYKLQVSFKQDEKSYIADAIVFLEPKKSIVIDAKFSLPNNFDFEELNEVLCKELAFNLRARIDELAKKPYANFDTHTYDFILLFIPYQNILDLILSVDLEIYQYAYKKKIYLTTPNTLFMALNTINISWRQIKSNENILKAFEELGKFYDKFAGVVEDFENIKKSLVSLENHIDKMENKLILGRGNLSLKFENLKNLGVKTNKSINAEFSKEDDEVKRLENESNF
ncbi:MAG: DNA recombination protein RmuC [Campylobacter sp.]|nr:DNA recombination protein RmuC [Campylobacter sp.]